MYKEVKYKEYIAIIGKLIRNDKYHFVNTQNEYGEGYKLCCVEEKTDKVVAYREKINDEFKNYILKGINNEYYS